MSRGYWKLTAGMFDNSLVNECDIEHIANMIEEGYTEGELIHEDIVDENGCDEGGHYVNNENDMERVESL